MNYFRHIDTHMQNTFVERFLRVKIQWIHLVAYVCISFIHAMEVLQFDGALEHVRKVLICIYFSFVRLLLNNKHLIDF